MELSDVIEFVKPYISDIELLEFLMIGEQLSTPESRWAALQDWLRRNPKWRKKVNIWLDLAPDAAYIEIRQEVVKQAKNPKIFEALIKQFIRGETQQRIVNAIGNLQELYKARKLADRKPVRRIK